MPARRAANRRPKGWQQQENEFKERQEAREKAEAAQEAHKKLESAGKKSSCKKARDELAWLLTIKPGIKGRDFVPPDACGNGQGR